MGMDATPPPAAREDQPTRWQAALFFAKTLVFRARRTLRDPGGIRPRKFGKAGIANDAPIVAESASPLYSTTLAAEFALQAGKVQNLRLAAAALDGLVLPAGEVFSFWANVPRPTRARGFAPGRELREGCVIPSIGGGLCQLSNALYAAALDAGFEITERHAHSRRLPGSMAEIGRDATIFWNYVDLRFRAPVSCQLEVKLTRWMLLVRFRKISGAPAAKMKPRLDDERYSFQSTAAAEKDHAAESCETCEVTSCFRNPAATSLPQRAATAWLVDAWWPEHDAYVAAHRQAGDCLLTPLDGLRFGIRSYRWRTDGFARVRQALFFVLKRSLISRRLAAQGPARQRALLALDAELAGIHARRIPYTALHLVVSQNLLPFLWRMGVLAGRTFDVLMTRLPLAELHAQLDRAGARWPEARTLGDFRADPDLVEAETAALAEAGKWITPHSGIAALAGARAEKLAWHLPALPRRTRGRRIIFPASTLARKGAAELREVARESLLPIGLGGPSLRGSDFWHGCNVVPANGDWLRDAAAVALPAWVENQPRRLLEAIAAGVPVIASDACGLDGMNGVTTIPNGEPDALRAAIAESLARAVPRLVPA